LLQAASVEKATIMTMAATNFGLPIRLCRPDKRAVAPVANGWTGLSRKRPRNLNGIE